MRKRKPQPKREKPIDRLIDAITTLEQRIEVLHIAIDELSRKIEEIEGRKAEWKAPFSDYGAYRDWYYWPNGKPKGSYNEDGTPIVR